MDNPTDFRVLVVDDDHAAREAHARLMRRFGYEVETADDGIGALAKLPLGFDLVVVDADMPNMDGFEVAERIRQGEAHKHIPIVMVTGLVERDYRKRALEIGINDFINKPVDPEELELRTRWMLRLKRAYDHIEDQRSSLERSVESRTKELRRTLEDVIQAERQTRRAHLDTVHRLMVAAEYKDADTAGHIERIGRYSEVVAKELHMAPGQVELIRHGAPMHDVGKIGIPDRVLLKPARLDEDEWVVMRSHTTIGEQILAGSDSALIQMGAKIAETHHEKWDGSGYPRGIKGADIPVEGRICAVVDFFDAVTMNRPYREAVPVCEVVGMMVERSGTHFDPEILTAFLRVRPQIEAIRAESLLEAGADVGVT